MAGYHTPDVVVIGAGAGGLAAAAACAARGLGVVVLDAGARLETEDERNDFEWERTGGIDSIYRWGPADRTKRCWPRNLDGLTEIVQVAGVGGTTWRSDGVAPRAFPGSVELDWPISYGELVGYYERVEASLGIEVPGTLAPKDERFVNGCTAVGLGHAAGPDVVGAGWRLQPMVSRTATAAFLPAALQTGRMELRAGCFAIALLVDGGAASRRVVRGVRYKDAAGRVFEQDAHVVVLAAGVVETPRLWLASGLPQTGAVGRGLMTQWPDYVSGIFEAELNPNGAPSMVRVDLPGEGSMEPLGGGPMTIAMRAYGGTSRIWGSELKRRMEAYRHTMVVRCWVDEHAASESSVALSSSLGDEHNPAPSVTYRPAAATSASRDRLAQRAGQILVAAGAIPESIHRANAPPMGMNMMGTMRMGTDPETSVVDAAGEAHGVEGVFIADGSAIPNALGGASPMLTVQALAVRTAALIAERYFDGARTR